jgi:hypothetical protein
MMQPPPPLDLALDGLALDDTDSHSPASSASSFSSSRSSSSSSVSSWAPDTCESPARFYAVGLTPRSAIGSMFVCARRDLLTDASTVLPRRTSAADAACSIEVDDSDATNYLVTCQLPGFQLENVTCVYEQPLYCFMTARH